MLESLVPLLPECWLLVVACTALLTATASRGALQLTYWVAQCGLLGTLLLLTLVRPEAPELLYFGQFHHDAVASLIKVAATVMFVMLLVYSRDFLKVRRSLTGEFFALCLTALLGIMVLASAGSMLTVYLGLELLSLSLYSLVAMHKDAPAASEAAMKYFVLGALASGMLLYGMSMIYGLTGRLDLAGIAQSLDQAPEGNTPLVVFGLVFLVVGIAFKLGVVPFHMWIPDVYQGAPTCVTMLIGSAPKLAGFALGYRLLAEGAPSLADHWSAMLLWLGVLSVALGNVIALSQTNLKRLFAYSTIAHMGFLALGLGAATEMGYAAALFYAVVYGLMGLAAFGVVIWLGSDGREAVDLTELRGLATRSPLLGGLLLVTVFSLAGIPPFPGFWAKWFVLKEVVASGQVVFASVAVVFSVVGAYYYLRLLKLAYFEAPDSITLVPETPDVRFMVTLNCAILVLLGLLPGSLLAACLAALHSS